MLVPDGEAVEIAPLEQVAEVRLNPNPRFSHIWERSVQVGWCVLVEIFGRIQKTREIVMPSPSVGQGGGVWSNLGEDTRSFVQVVKENRFPLEMKGRVGFDHRRDGYGDGRFGRGGACGGYAQRGRGRGGRGPGNNCFCRDYGPLFPNPSGQNQLLGNRDGRETGGNGMERDNRGHNVQSEPATNQKKLGSRE